MNRPSPASSRHHPADHRLELALADVERAGDGRTHRDFDRDHDAAILEGVDDPAETSEHDRSRFITWMLGPMHGGEHAFENGLYVVIGPSTRFMRDPAD